jgi:exo-beta-1,3-glucanase (GH17 family)
MARTYGVACSGRWDLRGTVTTAQHFGSTGRNPMLPDYSDFIVVKAPGVQGKSDSDR